MEKKQRFMMMLEDKEIVGEFFWRFQTPEIVMVCEEKVFDRGRPYRELAGLKKSKLFRIKEAICIQSAGSEACYELWEKLTRILNQNHPFSVISSHPFVNCTLTKPVILSDL